MLKGARTLVPALPAVNREMPLHPAARGIGRRLSGLEPLPPLLDSRQRWREGPSMNPTRWPLVLFSSAPVQL